MVSEMPWSERAQPYRLAAVRVVPVFLLVVLPSVLVLGKIITSLDQGILAADFHRAFWPAGRSVLRGDFAYDPLLLGGDPFVYPPLTAVLFAPIAALPVAVADLVYTAVGILCVFLALRSFGVRDWRCYGMAFLWPGVVASIQAGNLTLLLLGGVGLVWHFRARAVPLGLVVALLVSAKLFLWPLLLWLLLTRRYRAAAWGAFLLVALNAAGWVAIGAGSVSAYVHLLHRLTLSEAWDTYTLKAVAGKAGLPSWLGTVATWLAVAALLVVWRKVRRDDRSTLALAVLIALVASPIVWLHYLALLLAPVGLVRQSFGWIWLVPMAAYVCPGKGSGTVAQAAVGVAVIAVVAAWTAVAARRDSRLPRVARPG